MKVLMVGPRGSDVMRRIATVVLCIALLPAACSGQSGQTDGGPGSPPPLSTNASTPGPSGGPTGRPSASAGGNVTTEKWFSFMTGGATEGSVVGPFLFVAHRRLPRTATPAADAMRALLVGPTDEEKSAGLFSAIPAGTRLLGLSIRRGTATVDLSGRFESGGGTASVLMRLAQVVYTLTQFPTVDGVSFMIEGKPVRVFSGEGVVLDHPQTRDDFADQLPPILVESPWIGERVSSPVTVSGTANVFEGTVSIRVLDSGGHVIRSAYVTATCGSGCRGTFEKSVKYEVPSEQQGTVEAYESSAKNGEPMFLVSIPVTLTSYGA